MKKGFKNKRLSQFLRGATEDPFVVQEGRFRFGQLKDSAYYSDWTEESFLSDKQQKKEILSKSFNFHKLRVFSGIIILGIIILIIKAFWLQIIKHQHYYALSESNRIRVETVEPKRGIIYDRNFQALVRNKANFVLYFKPIDLPRDELKRDELIREISHVLAGSKGAELINKAQAEDDRSLSLILDNEDFYQMKNSLAKVKIGSLESYQPLLVKENINYDIAMKINLKLADWPGVFLSNKIRREYLSGSEQSSQISETTSLAHLLGYTGKINQNEWERLKGKYSLIDYIGKTGLEYYWEEELKGLGGEKKIEVDALGRHKKIISETLAQDGYNLQLSLDLSLQNKVEELLQDHLERNKLSRGVVIITNPNNGEILAMVSLPAYNNNTFAQGISQTEYQDLLTNPDLPLFNRAISGEYPSGSVIKPIFAAGALQERIISENTSFLSTGGLRISQWFFPDWQAGGHGSTDVRKAISMSVNTFFYYIGGGFGDFIGLGLDGLSKYAKLFGLGEKTGLDLPNEARGFIPSQEWKQEIKKEPWYIGDTYHVAIGQGDILVTPIQVANYTATIANGGTLYKTHLVNKILDSQNNLIREIPPEVIRKDFIDDYNMKVIQDGMRQTVTIGSGRRLSMLSVTSAGKTGTAQWSSKKNTHAWYIAFAPYEEPELSLVVLLEEGGEGSSVATPLAYDIFDWYFDQD